MAKITRVRGITVGTTEYQCECGEKFLGEVYIGPFVRTKNMVDVKTHGVYAPACPGCKHVELPTTPAVYASSKSFRFTPAPEPRHAVS